MSESSPFPLTSAATQRPWDARLARISGKTRRIGHIDDLASEAAVTISTLGDLTSADLDRLLKCCARLL